MFNSDSTSIEAITALRACIYYCEFGLDQVLLEGDAKIVIDAANNPRENFTQYRHIVEKIKHVLTGIDT